jgi:hypothetical protein
MSRVRENLDENIFSSQRLVEILPFLPAEHCFFYFRQTAAEGAFSNPFLHIYIVFYFFGVDRPDRVEKLVGLVIISI